MQQDTCVQSLQRAPHGGPENEQHFVCALLECHSYGDRAACPQDPVQCGLVPAGPGTRRRAWDKGGP